jgi:hypothetical protein
MSYTTIDDPSEYFQTKIYTGTGSSNAITNDGNSDLQPDWIWGKARNQTYNHNLFDTSRGLTKRLTSDQVDAENTDSTTITAVGSDGFTLGTSANLNGSSVNYAAWQWKANGGSRTTFTESSNNPGGGYQANTTAGFSIVDYTGTGGAGTVSHGLGAEPKVLIVKNRDATTDWAVYHRKASSAGNDSYLELNTADAVATAGTVWNDTSPSSSVFTVGTNTKTNTDGEKYIAYCFAEIQGYSKISSYKGNGNADGAFVYTGFRPAWILGKRSTGGHGWFLFDDVRDTHNPTNQLLEPHVNNAESNDSFDIDILSNGFKARGSENTINGNDETYVYMAFARHPFVSSKGVPVTAK